MSQVPFKPIVDLPASLASASVRYKREDGYTHGATSRFVWDLRLDRKATKEERAWLGSRGAVYACGWWTIVDEEGAPTELLTLPAPIPDDGSGDLDADDREAARAAIVEAEAEHGQDAHFYEATLAHEIQARKEEPAAPFLRCKAVSPPGEWERLRCERYGCDGEHEARDGETIRRWTDAAVVTEEERRAAGDEVVAAARARLAAKPKGRGPGSRCGNCNATRAKHEAGKGCGAWTEKPRGPCATTVAEQTDPEGLRPPGPTSRCSVCDAQYRAHDIVDLGHPFTPKRHGGKRAPGHPAYRARQRIRADVLPDPSRVTVDPALATEETMRAEAERQKSTAAEPDTSRRESEETCSSRWHDERCARPAGHLCDDDGHHRSLVGGVWTDGAAARWAAAERGEPTPPGTSGGLVASLRQAFPDAFKPEIIDGSDVAEAAEIIDLTIAFSPVVARRDSIDAVDVTQLDNGRFRVDALWESSGLPMEVDAASLAIMRARYILLRGLLIRSLSAMDHGTRSAVVRRFFRGVEPWCPAPGSPLANMGAGPITIAVPAGVGIEAIDWPALMGALAGEGGEVPTVVPVRPLGPPPPPAPPPEPPAAHTLEGKHSRACGFWKIHEPARCDPAKLAAEIKLCRACWGKVFALGGGRPVAEDRREYVGDRYR